MVGLLSFEYLEEAHFGRKLIEIAQSGWAQSLDLY